MNLEEIEQQLIEVDKKIERLYLKGNNNEKLNTQRRELLKMRFDISGKWS